jgi:MoxR-like ATPase
MSKEQHNTLIQRPSAEVLYAEELALLAKEDGDAPKPGGWRLTPKSVLRFVTGDGDGEKNAKIAPKFVGSRAMLERCIVALATNRGLMLIGEPGTAKSYLSELLAAAISGDSTLIVQGSAGTTEDNIKYSWNYALLLAEGPTERALVPAPLHRGMTEGKIVRFEELTRCPLEIQDTMLSVLSDRVMPIPERPDDGRTLYAGVGFNVIATANTRDRGVNEMSAALKRRLNFETIPPIQKRDQEMALVQRETERMLSRAGVPMTLSPDLTELLVTTFSELRSGKTEGGKTMEPLSAVLSTAEAVSVGYAAVLHAYYYGGGSATPEHLVQSLLGSALKDNADDVNRLRHYFHQVVMPRKSPLWQDFYQARHLLGDSSEKK